MQGGRVGRDGVREEGSVAATNRDVVSGERYDGRVLAELDGVAVDHRLRKQAPVDVHDAGVEVDGELGLLC